MQSSSGLRTLVVRDDSWETEPQLTVCLVDLVRSHPREVSHLAVRGRLEPLSTPLRSGFASSHVPYRLRHALCLRSGDSGDLRLAPPRRAHPAYHVPRVSPTSRGRMPLYTGRVNGCVGSPLKLTDLPSMPFWRWGRMVALAPPASRCVTPRLQLPSPYRPFPDDETDVPRIGSSLYRVLETPPLPATPPRFGNRWHHTQARSQLSLSVSAVKLATSCRSNARGERREKSASVSPVRSTAWLAGPSLLTEPIRSRWGARPS